MLPIRNMSYLSPMCCSFWEKYKNSPKTGLECSTPLTKNNTSIDIHKSEFTHFYTSIGRHDRGPSTWDHPNWCTLGANFKLNSITHAGRPRKPLIMIQYNIDLQCVTCTPIWVLKAPFRCEKHPSYGRSIRTMTWLIGFVYGTTRSSKVYSSTFSKE